MRKKIGECLIQAGLITEDDLESALVEHKRTGERLGVVLVRMNLATEKQIAKALAFQLGFPYVNLAENPPDPTAVVLIPKEVALKRVCIAVSLEKNLLTVAMSDPLLFSLVQDLEFQTGYRIKQVVSTRGDIVEAIQTGYPDKALARIDADRRSAIWRSPPATRRARARGVEAPTGETALARRAEDEVFEPVAGLKERSEAAPIIDLVDLVVKSAIKSKASDVHVEPMEKGVLIRHRLDGLLKEVMDLPKWVHEGLIARLKIMAGMDIAEKRLPQDGRLRSTSEDGTDVDFRVSTLRTLFGEKVVMRVLDHRKGVPALEEIGMSASALEEVRQFLRHQHGMILVVGPTGSGKIDDAQLGAEVGEVGEDQHHHDRGSGRVPDPRRQPDADQREDQADVRERAALDSAAGSGRHSRRRNPRRRDGEDRDAGRADRPPRALDAAHRRCAVGRDAIDGHRHRAVRDRRRRWSASSPSGWCGGCACIAGVSTRRRPTRCAR